MDNYCLRGGMKAIAGTSIGRVVVVVIAATLLMTACSRKGIHMSKHRKSRKCNCPTFAVNRESSTGTSGDADNTIVYYGIVRGRI